MTYARFASLWKDVFSQPRFTSVQPLLPGHKSSPRTQPFPIEYGQSTERAVAYRDRMREARKDNDLT